MDISPQPPPTETSVILFDRFPVEPYTYFDQLYLLILVGVILVNFVISHVHGVTHSFLSTFLFGLFA